MTGRDADLGSAVSRRDGKEARLTIGPWSIRLMVTKEGQR